MKFSIPGKSKSTRRDHAWAASGFAVCAAILMAMPAFGQGNGNKGGGKGGGGGDPPDTGTVYFWSNDYDGGDGMTIKSISPDGTSVSTLNIAMPATYTDVSDSLHAGARWILMAGTIVGAVYPDGRQRFEMVAASDAGAVVQITVDPTLQMIEPNLQVGETWQLDMGATAPRWTLDDSRITWMARRWGTDPVTGEATVVEMGMYYVDLPVDVASLSAPLVPQRFGFDFAEYYHESYGSWPDIGGYDWSPDGSLMVLVDPQGLSIANPITGARILILAAGTTSEYIWSPRWSILDQIVFSSSYDFSLYTISIDGSGLSQIATGDLYKKSGRPRQAYWSPNGTHLVYLRDSVVYRRGGNGGYMSEYKLVIADSTGGNETQISGGGTSWFVIPLGWTED